MSAKSSARKRMKAKTTSAADAAMTAREKRSLLATTRKAWGWIGLDPAEIVTRNAFGNLIVRAADGAYWRICPEEWSCTKVARNAREFEALTGDEEFQLDWEMARLVGLARRKLGQLGSGQCYCLKRPGLIGGSYKPANFGTISLKELIAFSGCMAEQIRDVPDGAEIQIEITGKQRGSKKRK